MPGRRRLAVIAVGALLCVGPAASAQGDAPLPGEIAVSSGGGCSRSSVSNLAIGATTGQYTLRFRVTGPRGSRWTVVIRRNGEPLLRTTRRATGRPGRFAVTRVFPSIDGDNAITPTAARVGGGEGCRISVLVVYDGGVPVSAGTR